MLSVRDLQNALKKIQIADLLKYLRQPAADGISTKQCINDSKMTVRAGALSMTSSPFRQINSYIIRTLTEQLIKNEKLVFSLFSKIKLNGYLNLLNLQRKGNYKNLAIQKFYTQKYSSSAKKTNRTMSAAAQAVPILKEDSQNVVGNGGSGGSGGGVSCGSGTDAALSKSKQPCFKSGLSEILKFMELVGNLKHTKRTGWVLRDVNDCESISGHMYRMSMMTFLLDGTEGLNQIRCMELALVHDLAESLVGDITPFCGVSKEDKRAMEFKAMNDICKLIEPRGKRIMELFEEYEKAESAESKFVKDLDRLDMVMQAFEYEKRDNCLLKHQEFFDSTAGKFDHPFVKKLVKEICDQRKSMAQAKGITPETNGHAALEPKEKTSTSS